MAENANKQPESEKRPPVNKRNIIDPKYTEYALIACYHTGDFTLSLLKRIPSLLLAIFALIQVGIVKLYNVVVKVLKKVASPFSKLAYKTGRMIKAGKTKASAAYKSGGIKAMFKALYRVLKEGTERNREALIKMRNYALPAVGLFVLTFTVFVFSQLTFGLVVEYDGVTLGSIKHEQVYDSAEKQLMQRVLFEEGDDVKIVPKFTLAVVNKNTFMTSDQITDKLIEASSSVIDEASGLYVDNTLIGAVREKDELENELNSILAKYKSDDPDEIVGFVKDVQIKDGLYPVSSIIGFDELKEKMNGESSAEVSYTVASGDTPYTVAQRAGISLNTFYALNPITKTTFVIGQKVTIASSEPFLSVQVQRYEKVKETVEYDTITTKNNNYYTSYRKVTRKGKNGVNEVTYLVTYLNGVATEKEKTDTKVISAPVDEKVTVGTKVASTMVSQTRPSSTGSGKVPGLIWPTSGRISCRWWGYYNHRGLDIAAPNGTPIYAAASGTVISYRNLRNGYGRHIVIDHGNGVQTLYAHTSAVYVKVGDRVTKGQKVAAVGRTGWATGYHLHFGIMINGVYKNPELYLP
ncbi:MAG: peptidoglycan DD-metalloendopeptidase family protein [Oscillospiraceae bacterium]|nr:peptidoglycan DD-metalloendopeptidase family protein [Oscillospiraceae bacterium]